MNTALYDIYSGLTARLGALDILANNIANVSSSGFKQDAVFYEMLEQNLSTPPNAQGAVRRMPQAGTYIDLASGDLVQTGRPLDLAIQGRGFFAIQGKNGETYYTRDGSFTLDDQGNLLTASGDRVMGDNGPVTLPRGTVTVDSEGGLSVDDVRSTSLKVVDLGEDAVLEKVGSNYFAERGGSAPRDDESSTVSEGFLEKSNVNAIKSMVQMMEVMRQAEALQKSIDLLLNQVNGKVVREVARV